MFENINIFCLDIKIGVLFRFFDQDVLKILFVFKINHLILDILCAIFLNSVVYFFDSQMGKL